MEVAMPMSGSAIDCYEDMFKEITRKLYGEDGLPELTQAERNHQTSQDRGLTPIDYDVDTPILKPEEHLTAFGLAALMQNGFPSPFQQHKPNPNYEDKWIISEDNIPWTQSKIASYNPAQKLFRCAECDCVGYLPRVAEHWLGTHSNLRVFQCPQCPYESAWARCVRMHLTRQHNIDTEEATDALLKNNPVLQEVTRYLQRLKTRLETSCCKAQPSTPNLEEYPSQGLNNSNRQAQHTITNPQETPNTSSSKRYSCSYCPYATDRRDLFTRHENIHREEKPFQCYVCQKQFNRADHVKKHFLRMHREHVYDLNRIRRHPPKNASGMSYYQKYNNSNGEEQPDQNITGINNSITVPNNFNNISRTMPPSRTNIDVKTKPSLSKGSSKKKGEKRFTCCYCSWSGVDNWCLKRHMNTHLKPFVCGLCDYKAARSERLATHVLKVHNKRACSKCTYLADDQQQLIAHQQEHHPLEQKNNRTSSSSSNILRNTSFANSSISSTSTTFGQGPALKSHDISAAAALLQGNRLLQPNESKQWKPHIPKQHGAARLFNYMEASDGSDLECDSSCGAEDMSRLSHRIQSDFLEAGDVGSCTPDEEVDETELPLFVCQTCGCEFEDDGSLETHQLTHKQSSTSPAKKQKENVNPKNKYQCKYCNATFLSQACVISHMSSHSTMNINHDLQKRSRKQSQPKKISNSNDQDNDKKVLTLKSKSTKKHFFCFKCKGKKVSKFNSESNLILHNYWMHSKKNEFSCEHCDQKFEHKYQVILHGSKEHINKKIKERDHALPLNVPVSEDPHFLHSLNSTPIANHVSLPAAPAVPDMTNASASVHKLGMFFDHSFNTSINGHMPLIIPTFPPN